MSKIKVLTGLVSLGASLLGFQVAVFLRCPHVVSCVCVCVRVYMSVCVCVSLVSLLCVHISSFYEDSSQIRAHSDGLILM